MSARTLFYTKVKKGYVRFILRRQDEDSASYLGLFTEAYRLSRKHDLEPHFEVFLLELIEWFERHLSVPQCLKKSGNHRAICWFKSEATLAIEQAWHLVHLLRSCDVPIEMIKTMHPGSILYEDDWQIVAKPRKEDRLRI